jgi:peptidoglycan/xylan/chitin deacetylase (PgdA/CDA1 family)
MRIPGRKKVRLVRRWMRSRRRPYALILGYHRIADVVNDPFGVCVSPDRFRRHLELIARRGRFVSLSDLVDGLERNDLESGSVALTFDDAYEETLRIVEPLLADFDAPATVFAIASGAGREPWWERLSRMICRADRLPDRLTIDGTGAGNAPRVPEAAQEPVNGTDYRARNAFLMDLYRRLLHEPYDEREAALTRIAAWAGASDGGSDLARTLTDAELVTLAASSLVDIGSHTVTHPMFAELPEAEQRCELDESKAVLEGVLNRPVTLFSYPNGSASAASERLVAAAGYRAACASQQDVTFAESNRFRLPRLWPTNSVRTTVALSAWLRS